MNTTRRGIGWVLVVGLMLAALSAIAADFGLWGKRMQVTFSGYTASEPLTNFPALVILNTNIAGFNYAHFLSGTNADLRFTDSTETNELNYEIDTWNTNGSSYVWVQVPRLTSNTSIWACWGKNGTSAPACTTNGTTWDSNYRAVWHFGNGTALTVTDSTTNGNGWVNSGVTATNGVVDGAAYFNGNAYLKTASSLKIASVQKLSVSVWLKQPSFGNNDKFLMELSSNANNNANGAFFVIPNSSDGKYSVALYGSQGVTTYNAVRCPRPSAAEWHHYTFVFDRASATPQVKAIYVDAVSQTLSNALSTLGAGSYFRDDTLYFMSRSGTSYVNTGSVDEVRFRSDLVSSNWVWACYMNQASNGLFASSAGVQAGGAPAGVTLPASDVSDAAACLNGYLSSTGRSDTAVLVYWGATDGGTDAGAWSNSVMWAAPQNIGSFSTNVALAPGRDCFYRYAASNAASFVWSPSSEYLITTNVMVSIDPAGIGENTATGAFTFARPATATGGTLTVNFTVDGSATRNSDYSIASTNTAVIPAGAASTTVQVVTWPDALVEGDETVILALAPGAYSMGGSPDATLTITNSAAVTGAALIWDNGADDRAWSGSQNWAPDTYPQDNHLVFDNTAATGTAGAVDSTVDQSLIIRSLQFNNTGANYHTVQIPAGVTLTVTGSVTGADNTNVVDVGETVLDTTMGVTGAGALTITNPQAAFQVRANYASVFHSATMDASGLATLNVYVKFLRLAYGGLKRGYLTLATTNTVVANELSVGGYTGDAQCDAVLQMGLTNAIRAAMLYVARGRSTTAAMRFRNGGTNCAVVIRGLSGGTSRCGVELGHTGHDSTAANGTLDFGAGAVDALFSSVLMGVGCNAYGSATGYGVLTLNAGIVDATSFELGRSEGSGNGGALGPGSGTINLGGGLLRTVTITMGNQSSSFVTTNTGIINLSGGTLQAVAITNGAGSATRRIHWAGGALQNYPGSNMVVAASVSILLSGNLTHSFNVESAKVMTVNGVISNAAAGASGIVKTNDGMLYLNGANTFTGETTLAAGTLGGLGSVGGSLSTAAGTTFAPGSAAGLGAFGVTGNVTLAGALHVDVDGFTGTNDSVFAGGDVTLDTGCALAVTFAGSPAATSTIVRYRGTLNGSFASVPSGWSVDYGSGSNDEVRLIRVATLDWPIVENRLPTNLLATSACMNGYLANTGNSPTHVTLYWGTTDGSNVAANWQHTNIFAGTQPVGDLTTNITGLIPSTVHYYRYYATNDGWEAWAPSTRSFGTAGGGMTLTWSGGAGSADQQWSSIMNWAPSASPQDSYLTFNNTAATGTVGLVDSVVGQSFTVRSLQFANAGANYHTVHIPDGVTLTLTGAVTGAGYTNILVVGEQTSADTTVGVTGNGTLVFSNAIASALIEGGGSFKSATLDLSGLGRFTANVKLLRLAYNQFSYGYLTLAATNDITVGTELSVGGKSIDAQCYALLQMGLVNTLNVANLYVARGRSTTATMKFRNNGTNCTATIRGAAGGASRCVVDLGNTGWDSSSANGTLDFGVGAVDARFGAVLMGVGCTSAGTGTGYGTLNLNTGMVDATTFELGRSVGGGPTICGPGWGTINLGGGLLRAEKITLGHQSGSWVTTNTGIVNLSGGTLQAVTITNGTGAATRRINWAGGTIQNYPGSNMTVAASVTTVLSSNLTHTFDVPTNLLMTVNGVISNAAAGASGIVKTNGGTLLLNGANTLTGEMTVAAGTLGGIGAVGGGLNVLGDGTLAPGAANGLGTFGVTGNVTLAGTYAVEIDISTASPTNDLLNVGGSLTLDQTSRIQVTITGTNRQPRYAITRYSGALTGRFGVYNLPSGFTVFYGTGNSSLIEVGPALGCLFTFR